MVRRTQLDLFGAPAPAAAPPSRVEAREIDAEVAMLGTRLPPSLRLGTSSWSFPGWAGLVYAGPANERTLARGGLAAYARHPLLRAVGVDRSHYTPLGVSEWQAYAAAVPPDFRFVAKAHEACTLARFPEHARYGERRGRANALFLDAAYAADEVVAPYLEGAGAHAGPLLFQLAPQESSALGGRRFVDRLHDFLRLLPPHGVYAVEVRNPELLTEAYAQALADVGAIHCVNVWAHMPPVAVQAARARVLAGAAILLRWLLPPRLDYDSARQRYAPFDAIVDAQPAVRQDIVELVIAAIARGLPITVIINNKAEGSAPLSAFALAHLIDARLRQEST